MSDLCRGSPDKKLKWAFHIYDVDGDGLISRTELEDVAISINELMGDCNTDPVMAAAAARLWVDRIFKVLLPLIIKTLIVSFLSQPFRKELCTQWQMRIG